MFGFSIGTLMFVFLIESVLSLTLIYLYARRKQRSTSIKPPF